MLIFLKCFVELPTVIEWILFTGARRDEDGFYFVTGRIDDMLNVSGHLLSTTSVESALVEHKAVVEAAVVGHPHRIKGECLYCFVTLKEVSERKLLFTLQIRDVPGSVIFRGSIVLIHYVYKGRSI